MRAYARDIALCARDERAQPLTSVLPPAISRLKNSCSLKIAYQYTHTLQHTTLRHTYGYLTLTEYHISDTPPANSHETGMAQVSVSQLQAALPAPHCLVWSPPAAPPASASEPQQLLNYIPINDIFFFFIECAVARESVCYVRTRRAWRAQRAQQIFFSSSKMKVWCEIKRRQHAH